MKRLIPGGRMDRKEFLSAVGLGAAVLACQYCLGGCSIQEVPTAPTNVDLTLNLNDAAYTSLKSNGGYVYSNGLIIAKTVNGTYVALSSVCTHAGGTVVYDPANNIFHCPSHGSNFTTSGSVINGPASTPLAAYHAVLNGTSLHIYS